MQEMEEKRHCSEHDAQEERMMIWKDGMKNKVHFYYEIDVEDKKYFI